MSSEIAFPTALIHRKVASGAVLTEPLFFPELARLNATRVLTTRAAKRNLAEMLAKLGPDELLRRRGAVTARSHRFELILHPPRINEAWQKALTLRFHAIVWEHPPGPANPNGAGLVLARVLELGIEVIADPKGDLDEVLRRESLAALRRMNLSISLKTLAGVQTTAAFQVEWIDLAVDVPTLKERAVRAETDSGDKKKSVLEQVATYLDSRLIEPAFEVNDIVTQMAEALIAKPVQSVLLIGPSGVGKTAAVRELVRRRFEFQLGSTPFHQTSGSRLVAGQTGFGMWEERCQDVIKEAAKKRAVLHVGPLVELMEVGKSECNHTGIATFLRPAIARGELLCIAECTPEQIPLIEKQDPQLLDAFRHVTVDEPDLKRGQAILKAFAETQPHKIGSPGLNAIDRLHRRYATYSAYPGRPLRFLENLLRDSDRETPITEAAVYEAFTRETGLPRPLIDPDVPLDLADTHRWFSTRVVGQPDAVNLVVDLLATIKAGLTRPNRPIASLLFIGPTGVGKTEMAKALAEFLFGSRERLTRFDMSEYADPVSVRRLVGGAFGSEGLLTAKVREQPFCVLLLDEVEKADASFFDLLLQALGEARLTDAGGRLADFRNTVVILTSNLGTDSFRKSAAGFAGASPTSTEAQEHFSRAVEQFLRPEMFNRLDRIVSFAPLSSETVRRIADREWQKVLSRDGIRFRGLNVGTSPDLLDRIAAVGFDPRYGARPLKRAMERELLAPLARQLNRHGGEIPLSVDIGVKERNPTISVKPIQGAKPRSFREPTDAVGKFTLAVQQLRRWHQLAEKSSVVRELDNEVYQLMLVERRVFKKQAKGKSLTPQDAMALAKLGRLREVADEVRRQREAAFALEDAAVVAFHEGVETPPADLVSRLAEANQNWDRLLLKLYGLSGATQAVTLALFSEHRANLFALAHAYREIAFRSDLQVTINRYVLPGSEPGPQYASPPPAPTSRRRKANDQDTAEIAIPESAWASDRYYVLTEKPPRELLWRFPVATTYSFDALPPGQTIGIALSISGLGAHVRFGAEAGLHEFIVANESESENPDVLVFVANESLEQFKPPEAIVRRGAIKADRSRRTYDLLKDSILDNDLDQSWTNQRGELADRLAPVIDANMRTRLIRLIQE